MARILCQPEQPTRETATAPGRAHPGRQEQRATFMAGGPWVPVSSALLPCPKYLGQSVWGGGWQGDQGVLENWPGLLLCPSGVGQMEQWRSHSLGNLDMTTLVQLYPSKATDGRARISWPPVGATQPSLMSSPRAHLHRPPHLCPATYDPPPLRALPSSPTAPP